MTASPQGSPSPVHTKANGLRLLFLHEGLNEILGSERCLLDLVGGLTARGHTCTVVTNSPILRDAIRSEGAHAIIHSPWPALGRYRLPRLRGVLQAQTILREYEPDVVHFNTVEAVKSMLAAPRMRGIPSALHVHIVPLDKAGRWYDWAPLASVIVGVSRFSLDGYRADGVKPNRLRLIPNAVDIRRLSGANPSPLSALTGQYPILCVLGSLSARKRPLDALHALRRLSPSHPNAHLVFIGDGEERNTLIREAEAANLSSRIHVLGRREDGAALMATYADVVIAPSSWEAMPLNVIEAQVASRCVVASDIPPHRELIEEGKTGFLYPVGDSEALSGLLSRLLHDADLRRAVASTAARLGQQAYALSRYIDEFEMLYLELRRGRDEHSAPKPTAREYAYALLGF